MRKNGFQLKELIILVIITSLLTSLTTGVIMYNNSRITSHISGADLNQDENLKEFLKVYASLVGDYYQDIDSKGMLDEAIKAMFDYLGEDYTDYLNRQESDALAEKLVGKYQGIGVQIVDQNEIYKIFDDSPAQNAGLKVGDKIISVNQEDVREKSSTEISDLIQKCEGKVQLEILREEKTFEVELELKTLFVPAIDYQLVRGGKKTIGYLSILTFSDTVAEQVRNALKEMENENISSLVIDVRGNTGG